MCCCADWVAAMLLQCKVDKDETMTSQIAPNVSIEGGVSSSCFFPVCFWFIVVVSVFYHFLPLMNISLVEKSERQEDLVLNNVCKIS